MTLTKTEFIQNILHLPLVNCMVRRATCPYAFSEDHEKYCYSGDMVVRQVDLTECPIKLQRRGKWVQEGS